MKAISMSRARYDKAFFQAVGRAIKRKRESTGLSIEAVAAAANLRASYVQELESGLRNITLSTLAKTCKVFNCCVSQLLSEAEQEIAAHEDAS